MRKLRLGVIGTGLAWERLHYPALVELGDRYEIAALANRTVGDAQAFAARIGLAPENVYSDYRELLKRSDIDAVDILVPIQLNYEVSEAAAKAGKNILCEKPLAPDLAQAEKYLELERSYGVKIMIAENYRYSEENDKIKDILAGGGLGEIVYFIRNNVTCFPCGMDKDTYAGTEWRQHPRFPGGAFLDAALHDIAAMRYIFGEVNCVSGFGKPQKEDFNPYLSLSANILFESEITGQYTYFPSGTETQKPLVGFRIFCTGGELYLEEKTCGIINITYPDGRAERVGYTPERGYYNELLNFYNAFNGEEAIKVTPEVEFGDVKTVFDILESADKKRVVFFSAPTGGGHIGYGQERPDQRPYLQ